MILLISDLHLSPEKPAITQAFYHFMDQQAAQCDALYILGDFFEVWLGDDDDTPLYKNIQHLLQQHSQRLPIYFMHGNRDFLVGHHFAQVTGVQLLPEEAVIEAYERRYLLLHGDALCTKDHEYMQFREMTRSQHWQTAFLTQPLAMRRAYANEARENSDVMKSNKAEDIMDVTPEEVIAVMEKHQVQTLIHGHTHRPNTHSLIANQQSAQRLVLGDWHQYGWYATIDAKGLEQYSFEIQ